MLTSLFSLPHCELLSGLAPHTREEFCASLQKRELPTNATLMEVQRYNETLYIVEQGAAMVFSEERGERFVLDIVGPGAVLGDISLLTNGKPSACVRTLEPCRVWSLDRAAFDGHLQNCPGLAANLARLLAWRMRNNTEMLAALSSLSVTARLARQLLIFHGRYAQPENQGPVTLPFCLRQADLADLVQASRGRVNAAMVMFRRNHLVEEDTRYHRITVLNPAGLRRFYE